MSLHLFFFSVPYLYARMNDTAHRARGCDTGEEYYALCARALEPSWSDQLVAALLGLHLREEEEGHLPGGGGGGGGGDGVGEDVRVRGALREDECRVARSAGCGGEGEQMEDDTKEDDTTWDDFRCWPGTLHSVWVAMGPTA